LKHPLAGITFPSTLSFYRTYEELKLSLITVITTENERFYRTYEELKHSKDGPSHLIFDDEFLSYL